MIHLLICSVLSLLVHAAADRVTATKAFAQVSAGKAVVVDVREPIELKDGKVVNAVELPTSALGTSQWEAMLKNIPKDKEVYTYCAKGGRADKVAAALRAKGYKAYGSGGFKEWVQAGAKTETSGP